MQRTDPATIGIVQRYNESFNQGEVDGVMAAMTGDCVVETPIPPPDQSRFQGTRSGPGLVAGFLPVYVQHRVRQRRPMPGSVAVLWVGQDGQSGRVRSVDRSKGETAK